MRATQAEAQANANESQARAAAGAERAARQAEAKQRRRAEASERQAKERLVEVERQRKQSEKNLEAALEAVDRMLEHVGDPELNDVPRVGPLRRKILQDAVAFYERIPLQSGVSAEVRFRVAQDLGPHRIPRSGIGRKRAVASRIRHGRRHAQATGRGAAASHAKYRATLAEFRSNAGYWSYI